MTYEELTDACALRNRLMDAKSRREQANNAVPAYHKNGHIYELRLLPAISDLIKAIVIAAIDKEVSELQKEFDLL